MKRISTALLLGLALSCSASSPEPRPLSLQHLENVHEIAPGVLTGAGPQGERSFEELAARGVRTVISVDGAIRVMKTMGTGENYVGLWASARDARAADPATMAALKVQYRETAPVPPIMEAMVDLDHAFEGLQHGKEAGWMKPPGHPDIDPPHEALHAREILTEILRTDEFAARPAEFQTLMRASLDAATDLESLFRARPKPENQTLDAAHARFQKTCTDCHKNYRNAPKKNHP